MQQGSKEHVVCANSPGVSLVSSIGVSYSSLVPIFPLACSVAVDRCSYERVLAGKIVLLAVASLSD